MTSASVSVQPTSPRKSPSKGRAIFNSLKKSISGKSKEDANALISPRNHRNFVEMPWEARVQVLVTEFNRNQSFSDVHLKLVGLDVFCLVKEHSKPVMAFKLSQYDVQNGIDLDPVMSILKRNDRSNSSYVTIVIAFADHQTRTDYENAVKNVLVKNESVMKLQRWWRRRKMRKSFRNFVLFLISKQKQLNLVEEKSDNYYEFSTKNAAAVSIQSAWRSYLVRKQAHIVIKNRIEQLKEDRKVNKEIEEINFQEVKDDDTPKYIIFNKKFKGTLGKSKGSGYVSSARLEKLVDLLLREFREDSSFETIFMNTIPSFSNSYELIQMLRMFMKSGGTETLPRAADFLVKWATDYPQDFTKEGMEEKIAEILLMVKIGLGKEKSDLIVRATTLNTRTKTRISFSFEADGVPHVIHKVEEPKGLFDLDELEVARQLTLISSSIFANIHMREFNNLAWEKKGKERKAPNILHFVDRSNKLTAWVCENIMEAATIDQSARVIESLIKVSEHCRNFNNFGDLMAIMTGLMHSSISRLKQRWERVSSSLIKTFISLQDYVCMEKNYSTLRAAMKKASPPMIPFLGVWMQDLIFIEENPTKLKDNHINFDKMEMISEVIEKIRFCSQKKYHLMPSPMIQKLLYPETVLDERALFDKSLQLEPRSASTPILNTSSPHISSPAHPESRRRSNSIAAIPSKIETAINWAKSGKY